MANPQRFFLCLLLLLPLIVPLQAATEQAIKDAKRILKGPDESIKQALIKNLQHIPKKEAIDILEDIIKEENNSLLLRLMAVKAIINNSYKYSFKTLISVGKKIDDDDIDLLFPIVDFILQRADKEDLDLKMLRSSNPLERAAAIRHMIKKMSDGEKIIQDEKIREQFLKEKKPIVLHALAHLLALELNNKNPTSKAFLSELEGILLDKKKGMTARGAVLSSIVKSGIHSEEILRLLKQEYMHEDWKVRLDILQYMETIAKDNLKIIRWLIDSMINEKGRLRSDISAILSRVFACKNHGADPKLWNIEFSKMEGAETFNKSINNYRKPPEYYGVKITTKRPIFVLDMTGSMGAPTGKENMTRMDAAKIELCRTLRALDEEERKSNDYTKSSRDKKTYFNVMLFSMTQVWWQKEMMPATTTNIEEACSFVMKINPGGSTFTAEALREVFNFADRTYDKDTSKAISDAKKYNVNVTNLGVDTIFLVTDGYPSRFPDGKIIRNHNKALKEEMGTAFGEMVKEQYQQYKININSIGILTASEIPCNVLEEISKNSNGTVVYVNPATGQPITK